ncbi:MAG: iron-sulfur cluster assembly scaffold protein [Acidobacteria bacterium]|nr:iron-sulfur cluster assembly scaffold protein [Acidobacteriota bacterium]
MSYSPAVLDHVRDPKYVGWLPRDAPDVGTGEVGTLERGTVTRIQVRIDPATGRIGEAVFKVFGCSAAIASASLVAERLHGATLNEARELEGLAIVAELQLPIERAGVAALAVEAAKAAIADWEQKR